MDGWKSREMPAVKDIDRDVYPSPRAHKTETGPGTTERGRRGEEVCDGGS